MERERERGWDEDTLGDDLMFCQKLNGSKRKTNQGVCQLTESW